MCILLVLPATATDRLRKLNLIPFQSRGQSETSVSELGTLVVYDGESAATASQFLNLVAMSLALVDAVDEDADFLEAYEHRFQQSRQIRFVIYPRWGVTCPERSNFACTMARHSSLCRANCPMKQDRIPVRSRDRSF
jgi:hypothetical protein